MQQSDVYDRLLGNEICRRFPERTRAEVLSEGRQGPLQSRSLGTAVTSTMGWTLVARVLHAVSQRPGNLGAPSARGSLRWELLGTEQWRSGEWDAGNMKLCF